MIENQNYQEKLALCLSSIKMGFWDWDIQKNVLIWDENMYALFGVRQSDFSGVFEAWEKTVHPDDLEITNKILRDSIDHKKVFNARFRVILPNGDYRYIAALGHTRYDHAGVPLTVLGLNWDVTAEEKYKLDLDKKNKHLDALIANMHEGLVLQDATGAIQEYNPAALQILGLTADEITGRTSFDPRWKAIRENGKEFPGAEHPAIVAVTTGKRQSNVVMGVHKRDGQKSWIVINSVPLFLNEGDSKPTHSLTTFADITARKAAEESLVFSSKMASLGEMAGGVAHEINNPLAILFGKIHSITNSLQNFEANKKKVFDDIEKLKITTERIANIVKGLRVFSRSADRDPFDHTDIYKVVFDTAALCFEKFKNAGVDINFKNVQRQKIFCQETQISQVLLNLLNNSFDAIKDLKEKWIKIETCVMQDTLQIYVTDSGNGISHEVSKRIMEPFFTTKEPGQGTGLGLSISKGIIDSHEGKIYYDQNSKNTRFVIELPLKNQTN